MKAIYIERYGGPDVLTFGDVPRPVPKANQVLVEIHAASLNPRDWLLREGRYVFRHFMRGLPLIPGSDFSGVVVEAGVNAARFEIGAPVFGMQTAFGRMGAYAEYIAVAESAPARKPENVTHIDAAAVPCAALTAYDALVENARVGPQTPVLIIGASGGVGSYAVQIAKCLGAHVTAVTSTKNVPLVESLGADRVIDYTQDHYAYLVRNQAVVFDTIGRENLSKARAALAPGARYITTIPAVQTAVQSLTSNALRILSGGKRPGSHVVLVQANGVHLEWIASQMTAGNIKSVIDSVYPLQEARAAQIKSRTWRTRGKIVLQVQD